MYIYIYVTQKGVQIKNIWNIRIRIFRPLHNRIEPN